MLRILVRASTETLRSVLSFENRILAGQPCFGAEYFTEPYMYSYYRINVLGAVIQKTKWLGYEKNEPYTMQKNMLGQMYR
jgi:hypothetical protein